MPETTIPPQTERTETQRIETERTETQRIETERIETERMADQLRRAMEGEAWHGPCLGELLADVTAEVAAARPVPAAHSIWEMVAHLASWQREVSRRLGGEAAAGPVPPEVDWPPVEDTGEAGWRRTLEALDATYRELVARVESLADARLSEAEPVSGDSFYTLLHGTVQHNLYHAGQIALLKKAAAGPAG